MNDSQREKFMESINRFVEEKDATFDSIFERFGRAEDRNKETQEKLDKTSEKYKRVIPKV